MSVRIFLGEQRIDAIAHDNRGLAYGDGLFETMRIHRGALPWLDAHWLRLAQGAQRLRMRLPKQALVEAQIASMLSQAQGEGVLKLMVTRGAGARGYAPKPEATPLWLLSLHPSPPPMRAGGVVLRWCETRLALQPALAGLKHCNRLEQVLARAEWQDAHIDDGLMRDTDGNAVCATSANLFVLHDGRWWTPPLDRCGVAGVCRAWALTALPARQVTLSMADVEQADAVFLCNAARGILPLACLGERVWSPHPAIDEARRKLAADHPAFADTAPVEEAR